MSHRYVALLRAITHMGMAPFRQAMEELGFSDVRSFGMSGNLIFSARLQPATTLERRISARAWWAQRLTLMNMGAT
jgi:uncharacterized protein (DUF1697 family)